jgi:glycosyltransferase involved in cell wall biosynthesis
VGVRAELIVVDDASRDGGAQVVERFLGAHPELPALLVRLPANVGIAGARNAGAERARTGELLFLDADDELLPHGPLRLHEGLAADPGAAFAYGLIALEGADGPLGLVSSEPWSPDLLRDGNYINALALVRAGPFREVGGFFAERGLRGAHVRQIVARYRVHEGSRTATADLVATRLMDELRERFGSVLGGAAA